jgi:hypothetical protein
MTYVDDLCEAHSLPKNLTIMLENRRGLFVVTHIFVELGSHKECLGFFSSFFFIGIYKNSDFIYFFVSLLIHTMASQNEKFSIWKPTLQVLASFWG